METIVKKTIDQFDLVLAKLVKTAAVGIPQSILQPKIIIRGGEALAEADDLAVLRKAKEEYQTVIRRFRQLQEESEQQAKLYRSESDASVRELMELERQIAGHYLESDQLGLDIEQLQARSVTLQANQDRLDEAMQDCEKKLASLKKERDQAAYNKKVSTTLKYIPFVNIGAFIYEAVENNDGKIKMAENEISIYRNQRQSLEQEMDETIREIGARREEVADLKEKLAQEEERRSSLHAAVEEQKRMAVDYQNRSAYCADMAVQLELMLGMEVEASQIEAMLSLNPPPFQLAS